MNQDNVLHEINKAEINIESFIKDFETIDPNQDKMTNVSPTFFYNVAKALIGRIRELEELEEADRELNGKLQTRLTELEGGI